MAAHDQDPRLVAIACQGGGSHAAFGAGVIDRLLNDIGARFRLAALSGTSGGAVNATLAWSGLIQGGAQDGPAEAQRRLRGLWHDLGAHDFSDMAANWWGQFFLNLSFGWEVSPYVWDLGARTEMERHLTTWAKLDAMPREPERLNDPSLFVGATDIRNGVSVAIRGDGTAITRSRRQVDVPAERFDVADVIASIAIPPLYKDVKRRRTAFWDGLFSINPPIHALTQIDPKPDEIWVIQINPQRSGRAPETMREIQDRRNELSGNVSLNKELDMIEAINALIDKGHLEGPDYKRIAIRIVGIEESDPHLTLASKFDRRPDFLEALFELGRNRAPWFYGDECLRENRTRAINALPYPPR